MCGYRASPCFKFTLSLSVVLKKKTRKHKSILASLSLAQSGDLCKCKTLTAQACSSVRATCMAS